MDVTEPLLTRTYQLLDVALAPGAEYGLSYRKIAKGADLNWNWVAKLAQRKIREPGVLKVEAVCNFLHAQGVAIRPARKRRT